MTDIRPFASLRFTRDPEVRMAPPYDVISEAERARYSKEPENIVHLTLPPGSQGDRDYAGAARLFRQWIETGVVVRDPAPRFYVLQERTPEGPTRRGVFALVRLADYGERAVLPHERTMPGPKEDRLKLTRSVRANLEPLFFLYEDRDGKLDPVLDAAGSTPPLTRSRAPQGSELALFSVPEPESIGTVQGFLADRPLVIADGHHRYETMLRYRDECRETAGQGGDAPHEFVLGYLVNALDPGTQVRAIHRVARVSVDQLRTRATSAGFAVEPLESEAQAPGLLEALARRQSAEHVFVAVGQTGPPLLLSRQRGSQLDVEVVHSELVDLEADEVRFDAQADRVIANARSGEGSGLLLTPLPPEDLFRVVQEGRLLPQKSTYFSPKVPSGLVLRDFA
jgi:uncharacterized protein (DUF1015 family)